MKKFKIKICKQFNQIIVFLIQVLNKQHLKIIKKLGKSIIDNPNRYESLIPTENADKNNEYSKMFKVALETPKNNNIAITGTNGSGKSSFLRTFEKKHKEWEYLHISLATFEDINIENFLDNNEEKIEKKGEGEEVKNEVEDEEVKKEQSSRQKNEKLNQLLEKSILQQIFYKEKDKTIPLSRFKRIKNIKEGSIFLHSMLVGILFLYTATIIFPETVNRFTMLNLKVLFSSNLFLSVFVLGIVIFYFYKLFQYFMRLQVTKLNIKSGEIEVNNKDKTSILNEHLDEILYFFEVTSYDVVVIEDLDRFGNTEIFIKLRELNTLINNSKDINRRVCFVYAIKDDMFKDKDRAKFFDFIIPIIPYINSSSSFEKIKDKFKYEDIDREFLRNISFRIDDMRLLINITNEYKIYKYKIRSEKLNKERLLSMIIYKNFYPSDFSKLHIKEGKVYEIFNKRTKFINIELEKIKEKKALKEKEINELENKIELEKQKSIDELRMVYILKIFEKVNDNFFYISNSATQYLLSNINNLIKNDIFKIIQKSKFTNGRYTYSDEITTFMKIEKEINDLTYEEREKLIIQNSNKNLEQLKQDLDDLNDKEVKTKKYTVSDITKIENSKIFDNIKDENLLKFLIRDGYIREDYSDYISYFFPGSLTLKDRDFVLSVKDDKPLEFEYTLNKIKEVLENLTINEFESKAILNYSLLDYMLKENIKNEKFNFFMDNLLDGSDKSKEFLYSFILLTEFQTSFINEIFHRWDSIWLNLFMKSQLTNEKLDEYFKIFLKCLDISELITLNVNDELKYYLESKEKLDRFEHEEFIKFEELLKKLNIKFGYIDNPLTNKPLFNFIYENNLYSLNEKMIDKILEFNDLTYSEENLKTAHLTTILNSDGEKLKEYIFKELNFYVENVLLYIDTNCKESEDTLTMLLNNEDVSINNKQSIIKKEETKISDITTISSELWGDLLLENKLDIKWDNLLYYYKNIDKIDEPLLNYLNFEDNYKKLSQYKMKNVEVFADELLQNFSRTILQSNAITNESYSYLVKSIWFWKYKNFELDELSSEKVDSLLKNEKLGLTQDNIDNLNKKYPSKIITFLEDNKEDFLKIYDEFTLDEDDYIEIFESNKFNIDEKILIIENLDLSLLDYAELTTSIVNLYLGSGKEISKTLFENLFEKSNVEEAIKIFIEQIPYLENEDITDYLIRLDEPYSKLAEKNTSTLSFINNEIMEALLNTLSNKRYLGKVYPGKKTIKVNNRSNK